MSVPPCFSAFCFAGYLGALLAPVAIAYLPFVPDAQASTYLVASYAAAGLLFVAGLALCASFEGSSDARRPGRAGSRGAVGGRPPA